MDHKGEEMEQDDSWQWFSESEMKRARIDLNEKSTSSLGSRFLVQLMRDGEDARTMEDSFGA